MTGSGRVSVVIPNWNGEQHLPMVLGSLRRQKYRDFDVTVVDDGSTDRSVAYLESEWPDVRVVKQGRNEGWASAWARGLEVTAGEYSVIMNNDIDFDDDWLQALVDELDRDPKLGFVTTKIVFQDDPDIIYQAGLDFYDYGRADTRGGMEHDDGRHDQPSATTAATGAGSMFRRAAIDAAGGIDVDYWMYCEDVDLGLRILLQGYRGLYLPAPVGRHVGGATMGKFPDVQRYHFWRNQLITLVKDVPGPILWRALLKAWLYNVHQYSHERDGGETKLIRKAYVDFLKALPQTVAKRRRVQRSRRISPAEFRALLHTEYPFPTRVPRLVGQRK